MSPHDAFPVLNALATAGWALLLLFPKKRWAREAVAGTAIPALLAILYVAIVAFELRGSEGGFASLEAVAALFSAPWILLAGWVHYLAFDLLIGSWEVRDAGEREIPHLLVVPSLVLTFLFGPAGWLLYLVTRSASRVSRGERKGRRLGAGS
jgi:hypothetical protein